MDLKKEKIRSLLIQNAIYIVLVAIIIAIIIKDPTFLSARNFGNILTQSSVKLILALGVAGLIVTQGTDLSVGRQVGMAGVISASMLQRVGYSQRISNSETEGSIIIALLVVLAVGALFGFINGFVISKLGVTPFIATMGMMIIVYGFNSLYYDKVGGQPIGGLDERYSHLVQGSINLGFIEIPYLVCYALVILVITWFIWNKTTFGKNIFAVGGNPEAAVVSGVNITFTLIMVYVMAGMFYALGGFLEAARVGSATNNLGNLYELDAIAACVVGGVSFSGGVGKISGVVIGVLIFTVINYGLTYINVEPYWQYVIRGLIIISAVAIDNIKSRDR